LKILVTGAYSTGKTTFVNQLSVCLTEAGIPSVTLCDSSREITLPLNKEQGMITTLWLLAWQISKEKTALNLSPKGTVLICDRGIPDILAHNFDSGDRGTGLTDGNALETAQDWCSTYDLSFFSVVDAAIAVAEDGVRVTDASYRLKLQEFGRLTSSYLGFCTDLPVDLTERVNLAKKEIKFRMSKSSIV
jgi:hypothetical protein